VACEVNQAQAHFDPCPLPDDVRVPLPGGMWLAMRKVVVPGADYWGRRDRVITIGDPLPADSSRLFWLPQETMVGGAFPDREGGKWYYLIGKYELSKAQAAAILGKGDMAAGLTQLAQLSGDAEDAKLATLDPVAQPRATAFPVTGLSYAAVQQIVGAFNLYCLNTPECKAALPVIKAITDREQGLPFFRLPTEVEWEYAARGGAGATDFNADLPVARAEIGKYAFVRPEATGKPRRIGTLEAINGIHDMFGNVQEMTSDLFQARPFEGKSGAIAVRGGSFLDSATSLRSAYRSEIALYTLQGSGDVVESRPLTTGFRLLLTSPAIATPDMRSEIEKQGETYLTEFYADSPGTTRFAGDIKAQQSLTQAQQTAAALGTTTTDPAITQQLAQLTSNLEEAQRQLALRTEQVCKRNRDVAVILSVLFARAHFKATEVENFIAILEKQSGLNEQRRSEVEAMILKRRKDVEDLNGNALYYFRRYSELVQDFAGCPEKIVLDALTQAKADTNITAIDRASVEALAVHYDNFRKGALDPQRWQDEILKLQEPNKGQL
jgi:hypothetical protein